MNPVWAGALMGAGSVMVLTWLAWEISTFVKQRRKTETPTHSQSAGRDIIGRDKIALYVINNHKRSGADVTINYEEDARTVWFGTDRGDMPIRFIDTDTVMDDIGAWLDQTGQRRALSGKRLKFILKRVAKAAKANAETDD